MDWEISKSSILTAVHRMAEAGESVSEDLVPLQLLLMLRLAHSLPAQSCNSSVAISSHCEDNYFHHCNCQAPVVIAVKIRYHISNVNRSRSWNYLVI